MAKLTVLVALLAVLGWRASAQPDCSTLNVDRSESGTLSGANLDVCQTSSSQCCSQRFLNGVKQEFGEELLEELRAEIRGNLDVLSNVTDRLAAYLDGETDGFLASIRSALPVPSAFSSHTRDTTVALANFLNRTKFVINETNPEVNTTVIILSIFDGVRTLINGIDTLSTNIKTCINNLIVNIDSSAVSALGKDLEQMRRAYSFLNRIENFIRTYASSDKTFVVPDIPKTCVRRAVEVAFCSRCQRVLPPLCFNTCGALVRGCYAPYVTGLRDQFNGLWTRALKAVNILRINANRIVNGTRLLIDSAQVTQCITGSRPVGKRQTRTANFPTGVDASLQSLKGLFVYGRLGPRFCRLEDEEKEYCRGNTSAVNNRRCDNDEICTSACKCWNGRGMQDADTAAFTGSEVDDQDKNPVVVIPKEESEALIMTLGTPVLSFLTSDDVTTILPDGITASDNASTTVVASVAALVVMILLQILLN